MRENKNNKIKMTLAAIRQRRQSQTPVTFNFKVRNEKRNRKSGAFEHLKMVFVEAKWVYNSIISQTDEKIMGADVRKVSSFNQKEFNTVVHKDKDGNDITSAVTHLMSSQRNAVITQVKNSLKSLKKRKDKGYKVGRLKFKSEVNAINLNQYGVTHFITGPNSYHIQGFNHDICVAGIRQLRKLDEDGILYELSSASLFQEGGDFFIKQTIWVDKKIWINYKNRNKKAYKREVNALDMGCGKTATDAFGNVYNIQVEESERLKRLQRKSRRQLIAAGWDPKKKKQKKVPRSNNWYKTQSLIRKEYAKSNKRKDAAAIQLTNKVLSENEVLVIQDENLDGWKSNGHGKKVQRGILGRLKERLATSPQVHVINRWVPTTKLCTNCGKTYDGITQRERRYVCPHCGHDDGERDCHSAKDMVWLYLNMRDSIGLDGAEFKREDFDEGLWKLFHMQTIEGNASE